MAPFEMVEFLLKRRHRPSLLLGGLILANAAAIPAFFFIARSGQPRFFAFYVVISVGLLILDISLLVSSDTTRPTTFPSILRPCLDQRVLVVVLFAGVTTFALIGRGLAFYLVMSLFFASLLIRAFVVERTDERIGSLALVVAGSFLLVVSQIASVPYFHRTADTILHTGFAVRIARTGFIRTASPGRYGNLPVFHTTMASLIQVANGQMRLIMGVAVGALFQVAVVAFYILLRKFNESTGVSLAGALLMGISTPFLSWGTENHAQSLSFVFFMCFLLILATRFNDRRNTILTVAVVMTWVLTHQLTLLIAIALIGTPLGFLYAYSFLRPTAFENQIKTAWFRLSILVITLVTYWTIVTQIIREPIAWFLYTSPQAQGVSTRGYLVVVYSNFWDLVRASVPEVIDKIQFAFWLGVAALGVWTVIRHIDRSQRHRLVALLAFPAAAVFFFPNPIWVPLQGAAMIRRWALLALPFVLLMPALGVRRLVSGRKAAIKTIFVVLLVGSLVFLSISTILFDPNITELAGYDKRTTKYLDSSDFSSMSYIYAYSNGSHVYGTTLFPVYMSEYDFKYQRNRGEHGWIIGNLTQGEILFQPGLNVVEVDALRTKRTRLVVSTDPVILAAVTEDMTSVNETRGSRVYDTNGTTIYYSPPANSGNTTVA